jgi:L-asparagine transporter-like permease
VDIAAATMANIGPAMSFFFGFAFLATTAGVASPLTIIAAGIAVALLGNTLAQFSRAHPSAGGFITFVGKTFGPTSAVTTAQLAGLGYIIAMASVIAVSGGFLAITLQHYLGWNIPWIIWTLLLTAVSVVMMVRGVAVSTRLAGIFFGFEMLVLVTVSLWAIFSHHAHLSLTPFEPSHITGGFTGLAAGFPLAIYLFIGWENSAALAEETDNPRRNVGRAVFTSVAIMSVSYVLFAYATVTGFGYNVDKLGASQIPFISVAQGALGVLEFAAYMAGLTSTLGCLIAGTNSQARLVLNAGREGLLPSFMGRVHPQRRTPTNAIFHLHHHLTADHRRLGRRPHPGRPRQLDGPRGLLRRGLHHGHHLGPTGLPSLQHRPAVLLQEVPANGVQRDQARTASGPGCSSDRDTAVLPGQARTARPLQLVPLRRTGHPGRLLPVRGIPHQTRPHPGQTNRIRRRRRPVSRPIADRAGAGRSISTRLDISGRPEVGSARKPTAAWLLRK